jgi:hypothetical protein
MIAPVLAAEEAYIGALLWLPAGPAATAAAWVTPDDIAGYHLGLVHGVIGPLATDGMDPDPASVLIAAQATGVVTGADGIRSLTLTLARLYDHRVTVPASVRWYAAGVLVEAVRRRTVEMTTRLAQAADTCTIADLADLQQREATAVAAVRVRLGAVLTPTNRRLKRAA